MHFTCGCGRCEEKVERGGVDTVMCGECGSGRVAGRAGQDWVCDSCPASLAAEQLRARLDTSWAALEAVEAGDETGLLSLLDQLSPLYPPHHYILLEVKRRLMEAVGDCEDAAVDRLARKVQQCRDHLAVQAVVAPGLSEYRAYLSSQLAEPLYWLAKDRYLAREITGSQLTEMMEEISRHLLVVIQATVKLKISICLIVLTVFILNP